MNADTRRKINGSEQSGLIRIYPKLSDLIRVPLPMTLFFLFGSGLSGLGKGVRKCPAPWNHETRAFSIAKSNCFWTSVRDRNSEGKPLIMIEKNQKHSSGLRVNKEVDPRPSASIRVYPRETVLNFQVCSEIVTSEVVRD